MKKKFSIITKYADHLADLQHRVVFLVRLFAICFIGGFFLTMPILKQLVHFLENPDVLLVISSPFQIIDLAMNIGFFIAIIITLPAAVLQMYFFFAPGLHHHEKYWFIFLVPVAVLLFGLGFGYGFGILVYTMQSVAQINVSAGLLNYWDVGKFASEILSTSSLLGILFQFPILISVLIRTRIISSTLLVYYRRHAYVAILCIVSLLPPTDGLSLVLMAIPMVFLYEITGIVNRRHH